jgi:hypothetical protein
MVQKAGSPVVQKAHDAKAEREQNVHGAVRAMVEGWDSKGRVSHARKRTHSYSSLVLSSNGGEASKARKQGLPKRGKGIDISGKADVSLRRSSRGRRLKREVVDCGVEQRPTELSFWG